MDKNTLSNYGWIVIAVLVLSVMIALATPFGQYIENGVRSTTEGLFDTSKNAVNSAFEDLGVQMDDQTFEEGYTTPSSSKEYDHNAPELHPKGVIPEGGIYLRYDESIDDVVKLEEMPNKTMYGDAYIYEDYLYLYEGDDAYNLGWKVYLMKESTANRYLLPKDLNIQFTTWDKTVYAPILESINGEPIVSLHTLFDGCSNLTIAPEIPLGVTDLRNTFHNCKSLTTAPEIPKNVENMMHTFEGCTSLTGTLKMNGDLARGWTQCLYDTKIEAVIGETTMAADLMLTKTSNRKNPTA